MVRATAADRDRANHHRALLRPHDEAGDTQAAGRDQLERALTRNQAGRLVVVVQPGELCGPGDRGIRFQRGSGVQPVGAPLQPQLLARLQDRAGGRRRCPVGPRIAQQLDRVVPAADVVPHPEAGVGLQQAQPHHVLAIASGDRQFLLGPLVPVEGHGAVAALCGGVDAQVQVVIALGVRGLVDQDLVGAAAQLLAAEREVIPGHGRGLAVPVDGGPPARGETVHAAVDNDLVGFIEPVDLGEVMPRVVMDHEVQRQTDLPGALPYRGGDVAQVQGLAGRVGPRAHVGDASGHAAPVAGVIADDGDTVGDLLDDGGDAEGGREGSEQQAGQ